MKNDLLEKINNNIINEINAFSKLCSEFNIYCAEKDGKYGIWLCKSIFPGVEYQRMRTSAMSIPALRSPSVEFF